jgi:hypothetical protein
VRIPANAGDARKLITDKYKFKLMKLDIAYGEALFGSDDMHNSWK